MTHLHGKRRVVKEGCLASTTAQLDAVYLATAASLVADEVLSTSCSASNRCRSDERSRIIESHKAVQRYLRLTAAHHRR